MCVRGSFCSQPAEWQRVKGLWVAGRCPAVWFWQREGILAGHCGLAFWKKPLCFHLYIEDEGTEHRTQ